jgi:alcohol dehydrogenase (cytochrome c)
MPITYDAGTNTIFAGLGNPGPDLDGSVREGDNLYSESTVALDPDTGKLKWYFQVLPHDVWDLDNVTETVLDEITIDGQKRRVGMLASKNGYFYVLDRDTGKCIYAMQYVHRVNWGTVDGDGTPHPDWSMAPRKDRYTVVYPGSSGGKEWCPVAYDPKMKRIFIPVIENPHRHILIEQQFHGGLNYWGGASVPVPGEGYGHLCAIDVEKKKIAWDKLTKYTLVSGVTCTSSGLVITGTPDQRMQIYNAENGDILYEYRAPSGWHSAPVPYEVDGVQYIAFANGWGSWIAGYDAEGTPELNKLIKDNALYVFALRDRLPQLDPAGLAFRPAGEKSQPAETKMPAEEEK